MNPRPYLEILTQAQGQTFFRIDHEKLLLILNQQMIVRRVRKRMGVQPGQVMAAILRQFERPLQKLGELSHEATQGEDRTIPIDMDRLLLDINREYNSDHPGIERHDGLANGHVNGDLSRAACDVLDKHQLNDQVATLTEGCCDFISEEEDTRNWMIGFSDAEQRLRQDEILQMVKRRFGPMSLRIIRMFIDRGKVDEKALQEIGLVNAKDLRRCLAQLNRHGFIDLQEVPREKERQPVRTIFLWFYDTERVRKRVSDNLCKAMCRLLQRLKVERLGVESTLQKAERSDVKGREHDMLRAGEVRVLRHWRRKELWYLAEIGRLRNSLDVFCDSHCGGGGVDGCL